jgi:uncharacterized membrane protein YfcA
MPIDTDPQQHAAASPLLLVGSGHLQSLLMLPPALLGMWLGQRLRDELSQESFRAWLMGGMLALGGWLVWQGLRH